MTDRETAANKYALATRAIHAGQTPDPSTGAVITPIYANSTYLHESPGVHKGLDYGRSHNPTRWALERCVADLEGGAQGHAFASGMAAIATILELVDVGSHIIAGDDLYGGTFRLMDKVRRQSAGLSFSYVDLADPAAVTAAIRPETRMILVETPTNPLLKLDQINLGYEGKAVVHDINLSLESGARYGLLGVNGSGKSTLIKALSDGLKPLSGQIIRADKLNIGYFAQHQLDTLRADQSPVWHIQQLSPEVREQEIRNFLGGFHFVGDMALQAIEPFSGGEKARLALAMIVWQKPNLLLLDEPTNHLDLDMRHALTLALQSFQGALIVVSHDRSLLEATTDQFLLIHQGRLNEFDGDLNDYRLWRLAQENAAAAPAASAPGQSRKEAKRQEAQIRQEKARRAKPVQQQIDKAEKEMARLSGEAAECEAFLAQEDAYLDENKARLQQTLAQLAEVKVKLSQLEENWLAWQEELEQIHREIEAGSFV